MDVDGWMDGWMDGRCEIKAGGGAGEGAAPPHNANQVSTAFGKNTGLCGLGCLVCWLLACLMDGRSQAVPQVVLTDPVRVGVQVRVHNGGRGWMHAWMHKWMECK